MKDMKAGGLNITFHNPNSKEEIQQQLVRLIAKTVYEKMIVQACNGER